MQDAGRSQRERGRDRWRRDWLGGWRFGGERRGRPNVSGYIVNQYRARAENLRLRVEALDASGKPVATTHGYVANVPAGARVYFEVPVKERAPRYRVTIESWEWRETGGL